MSSPLIVPVNVRALFVNDKESEAEHQRWVLSQSDLADYLKRPLVPYSVPATQDPKMPSVYLHWMLPRALRTARQDPDGGEQTLPPAPNRWLIVRFFQPSSSTTSQLTVSRAYIVNSDEIDEEEGTSNYVVPTGATKTGYEGTLIGKSYDARSWAEPTESLVNQGYPPLTAVGPGLVDFAVYQPYNENVFSFCDDLQDVEDSVSTGAVLDYLVVGWHAHAGDDLLAGGKDLHDLLAGLGWEPERGGGDIEPHSLYAGTALRLTAPDSGYSQIPDANDVFIAAGSTTDDAQAALGGMGHAAEERLLQAYLSSSFDQLEQDPAALDARTHEAPFLRQTAGYVWDITDNPDSPAPPPDEAELETERQWLQQLNTDQETYDKAKRCVEGLRQRLYDLWRVSQLPPRSRDSSYDQTTYDRKINEIARALHEQLKTIEDLIDRGLPVGDTEEEMHDAIKAYAQGRVPTRGGRKDAPHDLLPASRELTRRRRKDFSFPADPVLLFSGLDVPDLFEAPSPLPCRTLPQVITHMKVGDRWHAPFDWGGSRGDLSWSDKLPDSVKGAVQPLIDECALLSYAAATDAQITDAGDHTYTQDGLTKAMDAWHKTPPDTSYFPSEAFPAPFTQRWTQPWNPAYLLWRIRYYPLPMAGGSTGYTWQFDVNTKRYVLTRQGSPGLIAPQYLSGYGHLSPLPKTNANASAEQHARLYANAPLTALTELAESGKLGEISQSLEDFNLGLLQRVQGGNAVPPSGQLTPDGQYEYQTLLGGPPRYASPLPDPTVRDQVNPLGFQNGLRSGQFVLDQLLVVDTFGRMLKLDPTIATRFFRALSLTPNNDLVVGKGSPDLYLQLPPRIIQPTRLDFDFVSATDKTNVIGTPVVPTQEHPAPSPVIGWIFVDRGSNSQGGYTLRVYDPDGNAVVTASPALAPGNKPGVNWAPLPGIYADIDNESGGLNQKCPELFKFLKGIRHLRDNATAEERYDAYAALAAHIDHTALAVNPANTGDMLSQLNGRVAALLHARLCLSVDTYPLTNTSWKDLPDFPPPPYLADDTWRFNVLLGWDDLFADGLIGYYTHPPKDGKQGNPVYTRAPIDYTLLRTVGSRAEDRDNKYIRPIDAQDLALPVNQAPGLPGAPEPFIAEITLLADPWHTITATSDIQPVASLQLPDDQARAPLSNAHLSFPVGPLLASIRPTDDPDHPQVVMPQPSAWTGQWNWAERTPGNDGWKQYPITPPDTIPHLDQTPTTRTGYLVMTRNLQEAQQQQSRTTPPPHHTPPTTQTEGQPRTEAGEKAEDPSSGKTDR